MIHSSQIFFATMEGLELARLHKNVGLSGLELARLHKKNVGLSVMYIIQACISCNDVGLYVIYMICVP